MRKRDKSLWIEKVWSTIRYVNFFNRLVEITAYHDISNPFFHFRGKVEIVDVNPEKKQWYHENCNGRKIHTFAEMRDNSHALIDRRDIRKEFGKGYKVRRVKYPKLPNAWDDIHIKNWSTKSWKKIYKCRKSWGKKA